MKKCLFLVLLLFNIIILTSSKYYKGKTDRIDIKSNYIENNKEKLNFNNSKTLLGEENGNKKELKRKTNLYWILFLIIFIISIVISILFVYQNVLFKNNEHTD